MSRGRRRARGTFAFVLCAVLAQACSIGPGDSDLLARAQKSAAAGDHRAAIIDLKQLLRRSPGNAAARAALGDVLLRVGDGSGALHELTEAERLGWPAGHLELPLLRALLATGKHEELLARPSLDRIGNDPALRKELWSVRGDAHLAAGRFDEAQAAFDEALAIDAQHVAAILGSARVAQARRRPDEAMALAERADRLDPAGAAPQTIMGSLLLEQRRYPEAATAFGRSLERARAAKNPFQEAVALLGLADAQLNTGDAKRALETTAQLMQRTGQSRAARLMRARALFQAGELAQARTLLEALLAANAKDRAAQLLLGVVAHAEGNFGQADMYLSSLLTADPDNTFARQLLADARLQQEKPRQALDALLPLLGDASADRDALAIAGRASFAAGDVESGLRFFEQRVAQNTDDARARLDLAAAYLAADRTDAAERVLAAASGDPELLAQREQLLIVARFRGGDQATALEMARRAAADRPREFSAQLLAGELAATAGKIDDARHYVDAALAIDERNPAAHLLAGRLAYGQDRADDAASSFERAMALPGGMTSGALALAALSLTQGNAAEAVKVLEIAAERDPKDSRALVLLAQYYLGRREVASALAAARRAYERASSNVGVLVIYATALVSSGDPAQGAERLREAVDLRPKSAGLRASLAQAYAAAGRMDDAWRAANEALGIDAGDAQALAVTVALATEKGELRRAGELLASLRRARADHPAILLLDADLKFAAQRYAEAAAAYAEAGKRRPSAGFVLRESRARRLAGDPRFLAPLETWLETHDKDVTVRLALAQELLAGDATGRAIAEYEKIVALAPDNVAALNNLAYLYSVADDRRALATAERAYAAAPANLAVQDTLGWIALRAGQKERAVTLLEKAARALPGDPKVQYHYATALKEAGREAEARRVLERLMASGTKFDDRGRAEQLLAALR
jgi:putative PEP-CTERM system TPR-repeat lipoprotein